MPHLEKAFEVLDILTKRDGWTQFCVKQNTLELSKSSTHAILSNLLQNEFLHYDPEKGYKLGFKLYTLGQKAIAQSTGPLFEEAQKALARTAHECEENSFFGTMNENNEAIFAAKGVPPLNNIAFEEPDDVGAVIPFQNSAIGKTLLAWRDEDTVRELIAKNPPTNYTDRAILDPNKFVQHLGMLRNHGFTVNNREIANNFVCVAAPLFVQGQGAPVGGVSIVSTYEKMNAGFFDKASEYIYGTAKKLSEKFGAANYPQYKPMSFSQL